ncbi:MAG: heme ABC exporter ATP-binding protein CcmA [Candidatus Dormibacteraceae bacterium]
MKIISAVGIEQRRGSAMVLGPLDLELEAGERLAVLGENGAGKTTLLRILATLDTPLHGELRLWGSEVGSNRPQLRSCLGYLVHQLGLTPMLTALENLEFFAMLYGLDLDRGAEALERVGLARSAGRRVVELSRGMQQRLALARTVMHDPQLLILDEPDSSLDTAGEELLAELITGRSLVLATHNRALADRLTDRQLAL